MGFRIFATAIFALVCFIAYSPAKAQYWEGACGGAMRGYDGREYPCSGDRKPVCDQTGRCVCLMRRQCGGQHDQDWYSGDR
jgi:hypothetical protein